MENFTSALPDFTSALTDTLPNPGVIFVIHAEQNLTQWDTQQNATCNISPSVDAGNLPLLL